MTGSVCHGCSILRAVYRISQQKAMIFFMNPDDLVQLHGDTIEDNGATLCSPLSFFSYFSFFAFSFICFASIAGHGHTVRVGSKPRLEVCYILRVRGVLHHLCLLNPCPLPISPSPSLPSPFAFARSTR